MRRALRRLAAPAFFALIFVAAAIDAWGGRRSYVAADTTAYMNMVTQITHGNLGEAINGTWSPLYPLLLSAFVWPIEPNFVTEFVIVRVINFFIFGAAVLAFRSFLGQFVHRYAATTRHSIGDAFRPLAPDELQVAGWALFVWGCFSLNMVCRVSPDGLVVVFTFASAATLLALAREPTLRRFLMFGVLLGFGYWAKAILFVMAFVFLAAALALPTVRAHRARLLAATGVFLAIAAPLILAQSLRYGHPTYSEIGRLNYAFFVNHVPPSIHWLGGGPPGHGFPLHHSVLLHRNPDVYTWDAPVAVSYHPWYDPAYWFQGLKPRFNLGEQIAAIARGLWDVERILRAQWGVMLPVVLAFITWLCNRPIQRLRDNIVAFLPLWMIACAGVGAYVLILVIDRYLAASLPMLLLLAFSLAQVPRAERFGPIVARGASLLIYATAIFGALSVSAPRVAAALRVIIDTRGDVRDQRWMVGQAFRAMGVPRGEPVGSIGEAFINDWHRLADVRIVAEIPLGDGLTNFGQVDRFWRLDAPARTEIYDVFRRAGAKYIVANEVPAWADTTGWVRIEGSDFYYYRVTTGSHRTPAS